MSSYVGRHAELYDLFYADKPYREEADFVHRCLERHGQGSVRRLLELACGTGNHAFLLEKLGYEVIATDYSNDMLACARRKAKERESEMDFRQQDMRTLDVPERPFDAVICLFDAIGYVGTNEALMEVLRGVHRHLRPDGLFVFEFWHAAAMLRHYEPVRIRRWSVPEGEVLRISETTLDYAKQLGNVKYTVYEMRRDRTYSCFQETQVNRFFLVQEMAGMLTSCGLQPVKWFAGFREDERVTEDTWHIVALAQRT
jgi:SAM-dependent methyltransferase